MGLWYCLSVEFKALLGKILTIEPADRISLEAMKQEPWCKGTPIHPTFAQQQIPLPDSITPGIFLNETAVELCSGMLGCP